MIFFKQNKGLYGTHFVLIIAVRACAFQVEVCVFFAQNMIINDLGIHAKFA